MATNRLDQELVERGLCESREKASSRHQAGQVTINQQPAKKQAIPSVLVITLPARRRKICQPRRLKLEHALKRFAVDPTGLVASTLGRHRWFTDCLLQQGAPPSTLLMLA